MESIHPMDDEGVGFEEEGGSVTDLIPMNSVSSDKTAHTTSDEEAIIVIEREVTDCSDDLKVPQHEEEYMNLKESGSEDHGSTRSYDDDHDTDGYTEEHSVHSYMELKGGEHNPHPHHETYMKIKEEHEHMGEAPVMQRKLFGPPCWNPEQLVAAIESVKNGTSVSAAARKFGIPRTTLSNKIYGRRRKLYTGDGSSSPAVLPYPSSKGCNQDGSLLYVIGPDNEKMVANIIAKQKLLDIDSFSMTRAIFDIVKYLASDKGHMLKDDEEVKEWVQYFFVRHPSAYFPVTVFELRQAHGDDEFFADFVFECSKGEAAEEVLNRLMTIITRRLLVDKKVLMSIHLFWWYTFLTTFTHVRDYFLDNLTWPETLLNHTALQMVEDKGVHQILTNTLSKRANNPAISIVTQQLRRVKSMHHAENTESPTQVTARRANDVGYCANEVSLSQMYDGNISTPSSVSSYTALDETSVGQGPTCNNIMATTCLKNLSLGKLLAREALVAVERKLSVDELRYFGFRYDHPRLEDAYLVWRNLKTAAEKEDEENLVEHHPNAF